MQREKIVNNFKKSPLIWLLDGLIVILLLSLATSLTRQILLQRRLDQKLKDRQARLAQLEKKNQELRAKLKVAQSPDFLRGLTEQSLRIKQGDDTINTAEIADLRLERDFLPIHKRWWNLFVY